MSAVPVLTKITTFTETRALPLHHTTTYSRQQITKDKNRITDIKSILIIVKYIPYCLAQFNVTYCLWCCTFVIEQMMMMMMMIYVGTGCWWLVVVRVYSSLDLWTSRPSSEKLWVDLLAVLGIISDTCIVIGICWYKQYQVSTTMMNSLSSISISISIIDTFEVYQYQQSHDVVSRMGLCHFSKLCFCGFLQYFVCWKSNLHFAMMRSVSRALSINRTLHLYQYHDTSCKCTKCQSKDTFKKYYQYQYYGSCGWITWVINWEFEFYEF